MFQKHFRQFDGCLHTQFVRQSEICPRAIGVPPLVRRVRNREEYFFHVRFMQWIDPGPPELRTGNQSVQLSS
jgi:hypothetical protein